MADLGFCSEGERLLARIAHCAQLVNLAAKKSIGELSVEIEGQGYPVEEWNAHVKKCSRCSDTYDARIDAD